MTRRDDWRTPRGLFDYINSICKFTVDGAATKKNALCSEYWTSKDDALKQDWRYKNIWINPPYSLSTEFGNKLIETANDDLKDESFSFKAYHPNVVMLLPVRSDRVWFQKLLHHPQIRIMWFTGRLHFDDNGTGAFMYSVMFVLGFDWWITIPNHRDAKYYNKGGKGGAKS